MDFFLDIDKIQHYLMKPLITYINKVNKNSEKEILLFAKNNELVNDNVYIYSDPLLDLLEFHVNDSFND
ncbi:hypothetical protein RIR_jg23779.t1 [Rhizophagus irregularis DAOM 181602=DAOM 197198]|nr:hypothetical protein RIR_jg23779.t1 [Rhizophagus irregularis DAOM 181602=DAOM 197198]